MSDAIVLDVVDTAPVRLDAGDADPIAREEIAALATRVTTVEGDVSGLSTRVGAAESALSTLGTTVDGIDVRVEAIEADYVTSEDVMGALGGEAPALVSGSSRAMLGDPETASWMERTTAADGAALIESVKGNTLRWNQMAKSIESGTWYGSQNSSTQRDGEKLTVTVLAESGGYRIAAVNKSNTVNGVKGHKYLVSYYVTCAKASSFGGDILNSGTMTFGASVAGVRSKISGIFEYSSANPTTYIYLCPTEVFEVGETYTIDTPQLFDLTAMFGADNEPATVAEFEALFPEPYYPYDPGSLLPVRMEGVETVAADESWSSQRTIPAATYFPQGLRSAGTVYDELRADAAVTRVGAVDLGTLTWYKSDNIGGAPVYYANLLDIAAAANNDVVSVSCAALTGVAASYIYAHPSEMNLVSLNAQKRLWARHAAADAAAFKAAMQGAMLTYPLATPTTTPIDPPLPLSYRVGAGGTERVMVASGTTSAPPIFVTRYPLDPADLTASIAPRESATAEANHAVGDLIMLGWTLCKVTTAIARGETITIGTNVTKTSVAAEIAALS